jgi:hypothetical protein
MKPSVGSASNSIQGITPRLIGSEPGSGQPSWAIFKHRFFLFPTVGTIVGTLVGKRWESRVLSHRKK